MYAPERADESKHRLSAALFFVRLLLLLLLV